MSRDHLPSLLLLPAPPRPATRAALAAAYRPPLEMALARARLPNKPTTLIVAVAGPFLHVSAADADTDTDAQLAWPELQGLLAGLYGLVAALCARLDVAMDVDSGVAGAVDARVVLVDHDRRRMADPASFLVPAAESSGRNHTIVVDLPTFAAAYHPWHRVFYVQSEAGQQLRHAYERFVQARGRGARLTDDQLVAVAGGLTMSTAAATTTATTTTTTPRVRSVIMGGTFDHLHPGHKLLLTAGALLLAVPEEKTEEETEKEKACRFVVGVTGDALLQNKKYAAQVQPWQARARAVLEVLGTVLALSAGGWEEQVAPEGDVVERAAGHLEARFRSGRIVAECVRISNAYGPTVEREDLDALVVSGETRAGGQAVNDKRRALGWHPLALFEVDVLSDEAADPAGGDSDNFDAKISSTAIRKQRAARALGT